MVQLFPYVTLISFLWMLACGTIEVNVMQSALVIDMGVGWVMEGRRLAIGRSQLSRYYCVLPQVTLWYRYGPQH